MRSLADRLTYANVMATVAVFLALGGISWAATSLPRNSVGSKQLKRNAVTGAKVKDGSLTAADLSKGTVTAGPAGPAGPKGDPGVSSVAYVGRRTASPLLTLGPGPGLTAVVSTPVLPAGSYVVTARANVLGAGGATPSTAAQLLCSIEKDAVQATPVPAGGVLPLSMTSEVTLATPATVSLGCYTATAGSPAGTLSVAQAHVIATSVASVTVGP